MYDIVSLGLILAALAITSIASITVKKSYSKFSKINLVKDISGVEVARKILDKNGLSNVHVVETKGMLSDHYDPRRKVIKLSKGIFNGSTVASAAVAAHEVGHAIQDKENYTLMKIRGAIVPFVNFSTQIGYVVTMIGIFASIFELAMIGIFLISATLVFQLITLPVEFDASNKAFKELDELGMLSDKEISGVKSMLFAAAMTYVAGVLSSLLNILRLFLAANRRN